MDPDAAVEYDFPPFIRQYKSGRVVRYGAADTVPAGTDAATTGVSSRDVVINPTSGLWARLFLPPGRHETKLPVVVHGGAFVAGSAAERATHRYLCALAADAGALVAAPEYRLAPEHPLPAAHDDSWEALRWVMASQSRTTTAEPDSWLAERADLFRVFLAGASAGANIAHNVAARAGSLAAGGAAVMRFKGLVAVHPFFSGEERISAAEPEDRAAAGAFWRFRCPGTPGLDDPLCNPFSDLAGAAAARDVACERVLVCVAEEDPLRDRGVWYRDGLAASGYPGKVEALHESAGVGHVFHLADPGCEQARALHARVLRFLRDA